MRMTAAKAIALGLLFVLPQLGFIWTQARAVPIVEVDAVDSYSKQ